MELKNHTYICDFCSLLSHGFFKNESLSKHISAAIINQDNYTLYTRILNEL